MPFPQQPTTDDANQWAHCLTRTLFILYLRPVGSEDWIEAEERLIDGIGATRWLPHSPDESHYYLNVCNELVPRWRAGELYMLGRSFLRNLGQQLRAESDWVGERHGRTRVFGFEEGYERKFPVANSPRDEVPLEIMRHVRDAVEAVRERLRRQPSSKDVTHRRLLMFELYLRAPNGTKQELLRSDLNKELQSTGHRLAESATVTADLNLIRKELLLTELIERLCSFEGLIPFGYATPDGALKHELKTPLDELVRMAVQTTGPFPDASHPTTVGPPPAPRPTSGNPAIVSPHLLNQWWNDWPTDARRQDWDEVFAWYNPSGRLAGGQTQYPTGVIRRGRPAPVNRYSVLDAMSEHLGAWHFYRRAREPWRRRLSGNAGHTFPPADPIWPVIDKISGAVVEGATGRPDRVRRLDELFVACCYPFATLPQELGLPLDEVLLLLRAFRVQSLRSSPAQEFRDE
ncbi:hypothetical protein [Frigoriglobus tundricola]|uniref:Uncharacterized protein n=1 Tax=Frigoriglobus tundricola TaxID=2774151 RepID=A0A6M5YYA3_9BACT|nr:hypothetical protein [Frigoriglobus tundricola]QJW98504.1 hypothetical protein FTUN_6094 [Frigoriglobus tundricola]